MGREIRQHGDYFVRGRDVRPLRALDNAFRDTRVKVRILRIGFFVSTHTRVAIQLQHQSREHVDADGSGLRRRRRVDGSHQVQVERAADGQALRKDRRAGKHSAVRALFVLKERYSQARLSERDLLQLVEVLSLLAGAVVQNLIREREKAAARTNLPSVGSGGEPSARLHFFRDILPQLIHINTRQIELPDFLGERHAAHQIADSFFDRLFRVEVCGQFPAGLRRKRRRME